MISSNSYKEITSILRDVSNQASKKILEIYNSNFKINFKDDNSPLTDADTESNRIICDRLVKEFPKIPVISEENKNKKLNTDTYFLVDPLDGTKEFIEKNGEFTVNIALILKNEPKLGVIQIPVETTQYFSDGEFSYKYKNSLQKISSLKKKKKITITVSRSHLDEKLKDFIRKSKKFEVRKVGSSLKFCLISEGKADLYIRNGKTMGWDIAAGIAILKTAGGSICKLNLENIKLNKETFVNDSFICFRNNFDVIQLKSILKEF